MNTIGCAQTSRTYADLDRALQTYYTVRGVDYPIGLDDRFRHASSADLLSDPLRACDNLKQIAKNVAVYEMFSSGDTVVEKATSVGMPVDVFESVMNLQKSTLAVGDLNGWNLLA
ncbi:MAG: hypothetical protein AB7S38_04960 [Vulcanimicrobiota bacterium]